MWVLSLLFALVGIALYLLVVRIAPPPADESFEPELGCIHSDSDSGPEKTSEATSEEDAGILFYVKALYDYKATIDDEFDFARGELIAVTATAWDGWWTGKLVHDQCRCTRKTAGILPSNSVSLVDSTQLTSGMRPPPPDHGDIPPPPPPLVPEPIQPTGNYTTYGASILFYVKALYSYDATIPEEFDFKAGDVIGVTAQAEDGWWSGEPVDRARQEWGKYIFPSNFVRVLSSPSGQWTAAGAPILFHVKTLYDYQATIDEEFDFMAGDVIAVTATPEDGWWSGELVDESRRVKGKNVFPSNFVAPAAAA